LECSPENFAGNVNNCPDFHCNSSENKASEVCAVDLLNTRIHWFRSLAESVRSTERNARAKSGFIRDQCQIVATVLAPECASRRRLGLLPGSGHHPSQENERPMRSRIGRWELPEGCCDRPLPGGRHGARAILRLAGLAPSPVEMLSNQLKSAVTQGLQGYPSQRKE